MAKHDIVCAIDFGTTYSGYAFSRTSKPEEIFIRNDWGAAGGFQNATKTPTVLLITPEENCLIGYEALSTYSKMSKHEATKSRYFEKFKMNLYEEEAGRLTTQTAILDQHGRPEPALSVFANSLRVLKKSLMSQLAEQFGEGATDDTILWVVTVPAIWSDRAKQFMKEVAVEAGLVEDVNSENLAIALEPEAASILYQTFPAVEMPVGTQYIVLDAGGGTVDITVHEALANKLLEEVHYANGSSAGGVRIDGKFVSLLDQIFEKPFMEEFRKKEPAAFFDFMYQFESSKRTYKPGKHLVVKITNAVTEFYNEEFNQRLEDSIKTTYAEKGVSVIHGSLKISSDVVMSIFTPVVSEIVSYVKQLVAKDEMKKVSTILMVGGFSCSQILQEEVNKEFGEKYNVIIPDDASSAVVKGASIFGHRLDAVCTRVAKKSYGSKCREKYDPIKHKGAQTVLQNGVLMARSVYDPFVVQGQKIPNNHIVTKTYGPLEVDQKEVIIHFFAAHLKNVTFADEEGVEHIGSIKVYIPGRGLGRDVEVTMKFGGTHITVVGRDVRSNKMVKTALNFFSE